MAETLIIAALCGIGIGLLSGILGIGGGMIVIPLMRLGFGTDALIAAGTSLLVILPTSISGVIGRLASRRRGGPLSIHLRAGLLVGVGGVVFSPIGSWLSTVAGGTVVMIAAAIVIVYTGANMIRKALKAKPAAGAAAMNSVSGAATTDIPLTGANCAKLLLLGAIAGLLSGFIGVGGGFIVIPMLMWMFGMSFKEASGTSLAAICILSIPGIIAHGLYGHIDYVRGLAIAAGSIPGALMGSALLKYLPDKILRIVFGALLFVVAAVLVSNEFI